MVNEFIVAAEAVGSVVKRVSSPAEGAAYVRQLAEGKKVTASSLTPEAAEALSGTPFVSLAEAADAGLCVSCARAGIAATGSLLLELPEPAGRGATGLAPVHAVFLAADRIVPDLAALAPELEPLLQGSGPGYWSITTGPSRTADIERVLTIGVHGPKELHIVLVTGEER